MAVFDESVTFNQPVWFTSSVDFNRRVEFNADPVVFNQNGLSIEHSVINLKRETIVIGGEAAGHQAIIEVGCGAEGDVPGHTGIINVNNREGENTISLVSSFGFVALGAPSTIRLDGGFGNVTLGGGGQDGEFFLKNDEGETTIRLDGSNGDVTLGGESQDGDLLLKNEEGETTIRLDGAGDFRSSFSCRWLPPKIYLDGGSGEIFATAFATELACDIDWGDIPSFSLPLGMVMIMTPDGLRPCFEAHDKRAVGVVVTGKNASNSDVLSGKEPPEKTPLSIALVGKVSCQVDAQYGSIEIGDLLTTSPTPGHAMKVTDPAKAFGTVIGKALEPLQEGKGLISMLVTLQ